LKRTTLPPALSLPKESQKAAHLLYDGGKSSYLKPR